MLEVWTIPSIPLKTGLGSYGQPTKRLRQGYVEPYSTTCVVDYIAINKGIAPISLDEIGLLEGLKRWNIIKKVEAIYVRDAGCASTHGRMNERNSNAW